MLHLLSGNHTCPIDNNQINADQAVFWDPSNPDWSGHKAGWILCGACGCLTVLISLITIVSHAHNYRVPGEQRQILRILYLPIVYAVLGFLSYRWFSSYLYISLVSAVYEAFALGAFLLLLIHYVGDSNSEGSVSKALANKPKMNMPWPLSSRRVNPGNPSFLYKTKWAVLQYSIVKPLITIATVITQSAGVYCQGSWDFHHASVYLRLIDLASMICALYGLIVFYMVTKDLLAGRKPLPKFLAVKIVIFLGVVQNFILTILNKHHVLHGTKLYPDSNVVNGLNAICTCIEMVLIAALMLWAYSPSEYRDHSLGSKHSPFKAYWDSINISDFARELAASFRFMLSGVPADRNTWTEEHYLQPRPTFDRAFFPQQQQYGGIASSANSQEYQPPNYEPERAHKPAHYGQY